MKYIKFKRYKFSTIIKNIHSLRYKFSRIYKLINFRKYNFSRIYNYIDLRRYNFSRIYNYIDPSRYNFSKIYKYLNIRRYKYIQIYAAGLIIFSVAIYLSIPAFFNFEKSKMESVICKDFKIKCSIQGKINYSFFPSPRIKLKDFIIQDPSNVGKNLATVEDVVLKISPYNLSNKKKINITKIELINAEIDFDLDKFNDYKIFYTKKFNLLPINLKKGEIKFTEGKKYITTIKDVNFRYNSNNITEEASLKGIFLGDNIYINFKNDKNNKKVSKVLLLKLSKLKLFAKANIFPPESDDDIISGNFLLKQKKNRLTAIFDYKNKKLTFKHANLRNFFLDGKFKGEVKFLPYFNFNLDVDLNTVNFNRLYNSLIVLDDEIRKNLFKINNKINGKLNLTANKIFSKYTLINSFESQIKFTNGNILINQLLLNLGKFGAADITGGINNNDKFTKFRFENNIFIDNLRYFYNKFDIYNREKGTSNLFVAGSFDLENLVMHIHEISNDKKFNNEDTNYIEKEFNNILLENGYESFFDYLKLKKFVKLIVSE